MKDDYFQIRDLNHTLLDGKKRKIRRKICGVFLYENTTTGLSIRLGRGHRHQY